MAYSQLRLLAREFATGRLDREDYREKRAAMLASMVGGQLAIEYQARPSAQPSMPSPPPALIMDVGEDDPVVPRRPIILGALLVLAIVGGGGYWYLRMQTSAPSIEVQVETVAPSVRLVRDFLAANDFSAAATESFETALYALPVDDQSSLRANPAWRRLGSALRSRVNSQRSLADLDQTGAVAEDVRRLEEFASRLGLKIN